MNETENIFDIYTNKVSVTISPIEAVLTFYQDTPDPEGSQSVTTRVIGRVRMNPELLNQVCEIVSSQSAEDNG